jgi:hypothetical protein
MLAGTARAIADSLRQYPEEFPVSRDTDHQFGDQLYGHRLETRPEIDGYFDDWSVERASLRTLRGTDGPSRFAIGLYQQSVYLYVEVTDRSVIYATPGTIALEDGTRFADRISLISMSPPYLAESIAFAAEAPGPIISYVRSAYGFAPEPTILAHWQDVPGGYRVEARIPVRELGTRLGIVVHNTSGATEPGVRSASFATQIPGPFVTTSAELAKIVAIFVQSGMRLIVTDPAGWRITTVDNLSTRPGCVLPTMRWSKRVRPQTWRSRMPVVGNNRATSPKPLPVPRQSAGFAARTVASLSSPLLSPSLSTVRRLVQLSCNKARTPSLA